MKEMKVMQSEVNEIRRLRGFTMEPLKIFTLLNEEIGEVASELKRTWSKNYDSFSKVRLAEEIADVQVCLFALAGQFDIDIEQAVCDKFIDKDSKRTWKSAAVVDNKTIT
jgi:NTP pyrophosphatase (non-canonical NTP hydrolase)